MANPGKQVMVIGIDESDHSMYALEWTLDHFFTPFAPNYLYDLIIVHAKPSPSSVIGLAGPGIYIQPRILVLPSFFFLVSWSSL